MTISSLPATPYASLPASQSNSANGASASTISSASIGAQLLAALAQSQSASGALTDPLLQDMVSLSPAALGQPTNAPQTYNAQGLLQQVQSNMMLNDPLLQFDSTGTGGVLNNSPLQGPMPSSQPLAIGAQQAAASSQASTNGGSVAANTPSQATAALAGSTNLNANWAQLLQKDPALASVVANSQMQQGLISLL